MLPVLLQVTSVAAAGDDAESKKRPFLKINSVTNGIKNCGMFIAVTAESHHCWVVFLVYPSLHFLSVSILILFFHLFVVSSLID
jgi:hypothetical protein